MPPSNSPIQFENNIMTRDRETEAYEVTLAQLDLVGGGTLMEDLKLLGGMLSNISKVRSDISMTFARNAHA